MDVARICVWKDDKRSIIDLQRQKGGQVWRKTDYLVQKGVTKIK